MIFELLFNIGLFLASLVCFINITVVAPEPAPGNLNAAQWPQLIFGLLMVCIAINIIKIVRKMPKDESVKQAIQALKSKDLGNKKLFIGMALLLLVIPLLNYLGFIPAMLLFGAAYMILLGERRAIRILIADLIMVALVYVLFINLEVMLPRGIGAFRLLHLQLEALVRF